jgi:hypothetical protein
MGKFSPKPPPQPAAPAPAPIPEVNVEKSKTQKKVDTRIDQARRTQTGRISTALGDAQQTLG